MGCAPSKQVQVAPENTEPKLSNGEEEQHTTDGLAPSSNEINDEVKSTHEEGDAAVPATEQVGEEENKEQPEMEVVCGEGAELETGGEAAPSDWLEQTAEPNAEVSGDNDAPPGDQVLETLKSPSNLQPNNENVQEETTFKVGELDGLDVIKRFKLIFMKDDPKQLQARVEILKEEITKLHEDNEYRILRVLSSMNNEAMEEAFDSVKASKKRRCKSAFQGHLIQRQDTPIVEEVAVVENCDNLLEIIQTEQDEMPSDEKEGSQQTLETYLPPEEEIIQTPAEPETTTQEPDKKPEEPPKEEEAPKEPEKPAPVADEVVVLQPEIKILQQQDSAVESADGMISPHNSGVSTSMAAHGGEDRRCITTADEGLVAQLLQEKQEQETANPPQPPLPPPQQQPVEENPTMTTGQTFVVDGEAPLPKAPQPQPAPEEPEQVNTPQPVAPPPSQADAIKDDWDVENKQSEQQPPPPPPQQEEPTISVKISKKSHKTAVDEIKAEAQKDRPPSGGKHGKGKSEKETDKPKSRPGSQASSIASKEKKTSAQEQRPAGAKVARKKH